MTHLKFLEAIYNFRRLCNQNTFISFVVRPGHENLVAMTAVNTIADDAIRDVPPLKRDCYFQVKKAANTRVYKRSLTLNFELESFCRSNCLKKYLD